MLMNIGSWCPSSEVTESKQAYTCSNQLEMQIVCNSKGASVKEQGYLTTIMKGRGMAHSRNAIEEIYFPTDNSQIQNKTDVTMRQS